MKKSHVALAAAGDCIYATSFVSCTTPRLYEEDGTIGGKRTMSQYFGFRRLRLLPVLFSLFLGSCFWGDQLTVTVSEGTMQDSVSISIGGVNIGGCGTFSAGLYICVFEENYESSPQILSEPQLLFRLALLDPLVLQLPEDVSNVQGSYLHNDTGTSGSLLVSGPRSSINIDVDRSLAAEPGKRLFVIGLPDGAPTTGNFSFNLNFDIPHGTNSLEVKPIITGQVELTDGSLFYPPLLPCVTDMASVPALDVPIPVPDDIFTLPTLPPNLGCSGVTYNMIPGAPTPPPSTGETRPIPLLGPWGLAALTSLLGALGAWAATRRRQGKQSPARQRETLH